MLDREVEESIRCTDMQNLDISDSLLKLGKYIKQNENIVEFCHDHMNKDLKVFVGDLLRRDIPAVNDCPYVVITDWFKKEGQNVEFCAYRATMYIGVATDELYYAEQDGVIIPDIYDVGAKLMTLIEQELNSEQRNRPLAICEVDSPVPITADGRHWQGRMKIELRIYQAMGSCYQEEL